MKLLFATLCFASSLAIKLEDGHAQLRVRYLPEDSGRGDFFLENNSRFSYATLVETSPGEYGVELMDVRDWTGEQIWRLEDDGRVRSIGEPSLCWKIRGNPRVLQVANCDSSSGRRTRFTFDIEDYEDATGHIVAGDSSCLREADTDGVIVADPVCESWDSFHWMPVPVQYFTIYGTDNGCIVPSCFANAISFATCDYPTDSNIISQFRQDRYGLVHSRLAPNMCLQAAHGNIVGDGSKMRFYPCNKNNENQQFESIADSGTIQLKNRMDLCVVAQGDPPTKDVSEIIFKDCGIAGSRASSWTTAPPRN